MAVFFTVLIPVTAAVVIVRIACRTASHTFRCRHCAGEFKIQWYRVLFTAHSDREYTLTCPHCGTRDRCTEEIP